jgi:hypothetical protein
MGADFEAERDGGHTEADEFQSLEERKEKEKRFNTGAQRHEGKRDGINNEFRMRYKRNTER